MSLSVNKEVLAVRLNIQLFIVSVVAGVIATIVDVLMYHVLGEVMSPRILIPLLVIIFSLILCAAVSVYMAFFGNGEEMCFMLDGRVMLTIGLVCGVVLLFFVSMLLEWIYDSDSKTVPQSTSYIFILDESGSMSGNDPQFERYDAVQTVMDEMTTDCPYAVYIFSNDCVLIRPMSNSEGGQVSRPFDADSTMMGGTYLRNALETVLADIQSGKLAAGDAHHVILLTDGYASDMSIFHGQKVLRTMESEGIRVSTVGLGAVDKYLMQRIANKTGGTFLMVENATDLAQSFANVTKVNSQRNLLSVRSGVNSDALYFILRILFLVIIGAILGCLKAMACGDDCFLVFLVSVAAALVGALVIEVGLLAGLPEFLPQIVFWVLLSLTPNRIPLPTYRHSSGSVQVQSSYATHSSGGNPSVPEQIQW